MSREILEKIGIDMGKLVAEKNAAYGDSFFKGGELLKQLYPNGVKPDQYTDMLAVIRIIDKLFRIATDKSAFSEEPYKDICGYALLGISNDRKKKKSK